MDSNIPSELEQIQPIYLAQAQIFTFDPEETKQWVPLGQAVVPISILYDAIRGIYRIISVDQQCQQVLVNSTIYPELEFLRTSLKFGHWTDQATGTIYGIGFASDNEHDSFFDCLTKVKSAVVGLMKEPPFGDEITTPAGYTTSRSERQDNNSPRMHLGQGEGVNDDGTSVRPKCILPSWTDYEHRGGGLNLAGLLEQANRTHGEVPHPNNPTNRRPETFSVADSPFTSPRIEELKVKPPVYKPPMQYLIGHNGGTQASARGQESSLNTAGRDMNNNQGHNMISAANEAREHEFLKEIHRLKTENSKLKEALVENSTTAKKWEIELDSLRSDNAEFVKTMNELNLQNEDLRNEIQEYKQECSRLSRVQINANDEAIRQLTDEKAHLETKVQDLHNSLENARIQMRSTPGSSSIGSLTCGSSMTSSMSSIGSSNTIIHQKQVQEMEDYYRKMLSDTQKKLDEAVAINENGKHAVNRVDGLFVKSIHELIAIHEQLRQTYPNNEKNNTNRTNNNINKNNQS